MFNEWTKTVSDLNSNRNTANINKAKELKKKYLRKGRILKVLGIIFVIVFVSSFITFSVVNFGRGMSAVSIAIEIVSSILFVPSAALIGFGATYSRLGSRIDLLLTQPSSFSEVNDNDNTCPYCGDVITKGELFCSNCGKKIDNTCPKCGHINDINNNYCEKCGEYLRK